MRWHAELRLEVLGQEGVDPRDGQDVQHAARCPTHEDVVVQQPLDRLGEVCGQQHSTVRDTDTQLQTSAVRVGSPSDSRAHRADSARRSGGEEGGGANRGAPTLSFRR